MFSINRACHNRPHRTEDATRPLWRSLPSVVRLLLTGTTQAHDEERNEEGGQSIALDLPEFEIPNDCTDAQCQHND